MNLLKSFPNRAVPPRIGVREHARRIMADRLVLHYQPRFSLVEQKVTGFEALARWRHPALGLLSPNVFIPVAENNGLIVALSQWILREACSQLSIWQRTYPMRQPLTVSVNTSFSYLTHDGMTDDVESALSESGLNPGSLSFEVNEQSMMEHGNAAAGALRRLKNMGIGLEIDDFGTGGDGVGYLRELPFDTLKIDRFFVSRLGTRYDSSGVIRTILSFAESRNIRVSAEGVENEEQLDRLTGIGYQCGQGFYFSYPLGSGEVDGFFSHRKWYRCRRAPPASNGN